MKRIKQSNNLSAVASAKVGRTIKQFFFSALFAVFAAVPAFATWTYSDSTLANEDWTITSATRRNSSGKYYLQITGSVSRQEGSSSTTLDMTGAAAAANVSYIELWASIGSDLGVTKFVATDVSYIREWKGLYGNTTVQEVVLDPKCTSLYNGVFANTPALRSITTDYVTYLGESTFENTGLAGDLTFPALTTMNGAKAFYCSTNITSLTFPKLQTVSKSYCFSGMSALTNFCMPKATSVSTVSFYYEQQSKNSTKLQSVTLSSEATQIPYFINCKALERITPTEFPKLTTEVRFQNCSKLVCDLSFPLVSSMSDSAFQNSGVTSLYMPSLKTLPNYSFNGCKNLSSMTMKGAAASGFSRRNFYGVANSCVVDWCSTNVPSGFVGAWDNSLGRQAYVFEAADSRYPSILKVRLTEDNRAALEALCTTLAANFTDAHRAIPNYAMVAKKAIGFVGTPKLSGGVVTSVSGVQPQGFFWLVDGTPVASVDVTIACPAGVKVAKVTSGGFDVLANDDGSYTIETEGGATMDVTYAPTEGKLFTDGTTSVTVTNLTPVATIEASVCPKTTVDALARIGDTLYLTLQDAANVGGEVTLMTNQTLAAAVTVAADKAVSLELAGKTLTVSGTAFDVAGTLTVTGTGLIDTATPFSGAGTVQLMGGTYRIDIGSLCVPGYVATAQGTEPETWTVAPNTDVTTLTLDTVTFAAEHIAAVALVTTAPVLCETNGTVITWTIAKRLPFALTYTVSGSYRFEDRSKTGTVAYASGITGGTTVDLASVPTRVYHPTWSWNKSAGTCTDGNWTFTCSKSTGLVTVGGVKGISLSAHQSGCGDLDLVTFKDDVGEGVDVIMLTGTLFRYKPNTVTNVCAPAVRYIDHRVFGSENDSWRPLKTAEFSPDISYITQYNLGSCQRLERLVPMSFPKLTTFNDTLNDCSKLTGDISMPKVTKLAGSCFKGSGITSVYAPSVTNMPDYCFQECKSLTNLTIKGSASVIGRVFISRVPDNFVLNWLGEGVPTGFIQGYVYEDGVKVQRMSIQSENPLSPAILRATITDENRAAWEALCTKTKKNLTATHRAISNYPLVRGSKLIGFVGTPKTDKSGNLTTITAVEPKGIFWVVDNRKTPGLSIIVR